MPTEEERERLELKELAANRDNWRETEKELANYAKAYPNRVFVGEGDTPEEAEAKVQQLAQRIEAQNLATEAKMREMESAVERDYDQALKTTDPNSLIGQIVRHFPPMSGEQLMARISGPMNAVDDHEPSSRDIAAGQGVAATVAALVDADEQRRLAEEPKLQFFDSKHLPPNLAVVSIEFNYLAHWIVEHCPRNAERTIALNWLCMAKDAAVRARIYKEPAK